MESVKGNESLLKGIEEDAVQEAEKILAEAKSYAEEREAAAIKQAATILKQSETKAAEQAAAIRKEAEAKLSVEKRHIMLTEQDALQRMVMGKVVQKLQNMITDPEYRAVLKAWIIEAGIGLQSSQAWVNATLQERSFVTESMLREAEQEIKNLVGLKVELGILDEDPLARQGIVLTSDDRRTAYNNQVHTRLQRFQSQIRKILYSELFDSH